MPELRQDPITHDWVILNPERGQRPRDSDAAAARCPFCPGNEELTPAAVDTIADAAGNWVVRAVPNRYPALSAAAASGNTRHVPAGWHSQPGYGHHEVIIESPDHDASPATMTPEQLTQVLRMYVRRFRAFAALGERVRQIVLFRNHGRRAGTSLTHAHAQIVATPVVAPETRWRLAEEIACFDATGGCGLCQVLATEHAAGARLVHEDRDYVTLAPFASRAPYHLQVIPRRHAASFLDVEEAGVGSLAAHLRRTLYALHRLLGDPDYNLVVVTPPVDQVHRHANHWFIDIVPRLTTPAGFELGSRIVINVQTPEQAAAELRGCL